MDQVKVRSFGRDVAVNVLANLIAAAAIYLGAVASGYLAANPLALVIAVAVLANAAGVGLRASLRGRSARENLLAVRVALYPTQERLAKIFRLALTLSGLDPTTKRRNSKS